MTLAVTGQTGNFAISSGLVKTAAGAASAAINGNGTPYYHVVDYDGRQISMRQGGTPDGASVNILEFVDGGQQGGVLLKLTQQNVIDLVAAMVTFANTATLS